MTSSDEQYCTKCLNLLRECFRKGNFSLLVAGLKMVPSPDREIKEMSKKGHCHCVKGNIRTNVLGHRINETEENIDI